MELDSILHFLENKSILVTGATGFLAKVLIEKILRVQPNVKKMYLLLRAADSSSALHRFNTEVLGKELFMVVNEKYGAKLECLILEKISVIPGDVTLDNLGLPDSTLEELFRQVEIVINSAGTTDFDGRAFSLTPMLRRNSFRISAVTMIPIMQHANKYDTELGINTIGPANVLNFSKKCSKLSVFLHVSTAYVCGEKEGLILETPLKLDDTPGLDIEIEKKVVEEKLKELQAENASQNCISSAMKDLASQRARKYGWPNVYTFTKAMGEMLLGELKEKVPLVIMRPTIVTSTFKEPFPGWIERVRHVDNFIVGYGKGKMTYFLGNPQTIVDLIPADMVVNAMIASMAAHTNEPYTHVIYHVGSSMSNPVQYGRLQDYAFRVFTERPWMNTDGTPIVVPRGTQLSTRDSVRRYMLLHYLIPLKIGGVVNTLSCQYFAKKYAELSRKMMFLMRLVQLFSTYAFFEGVFDDMNTERLRRTTMERCGNGNEIFYFDPKSIKWDDYFMYTHIAGVAKYTLRQ